MSCKVNGCGYFADLSVEVTLVDDPANPYVQVSSDQPLRGISSGILGGGMVRFRHVINRQVTKSYLCDEPATEMSCFLQQRGLAPEQSIGLLTAAYVADMGFHCEQAVIPIEAGLGRIRALDEEREEMAHDQTLTVCAWVTTGFGNSARAGVTLPSEALYPGTINTIVLIDGDVADGALVNAVITATEAKAAALQDLRVAMKPGSELAATGTTTDAIVIASTGRGRSHRYAGTATQLGHSIGRAVYEATMASGRRYFSAKSTSPRVQ
jgi:adenosylcobinamide hydrolase